MGFETRAHRRENIGSSASFCVHESMAKHVKLNLPVTCATTALIDVSISGCALDAPCMLPHDTLLKIDIDPKPFADAAGIVRKEPIVAMGSVKSCVMHSVGHFRLGIHFEEIKKEDVALIDAFIRSRIK